MLTENEFHKNPWNHIAAPAYIIRLFINVSNGWFTCIIIDLKNFTCDLNVLTGSQHMQMDAMNLDGFKWQIIRNAVNAKWKQTHKINF